jgi:hypothetical protein
MLPTAQCNAEALPFGDRIRHRFTPSASAMSRARTSRCRNAPRSLPEASRSLIAWPARASI